MPGVVLPGLDEDLDAVTDLHLRLAAGRWDELVEGDLPFGLVADVDDDEVLGDLDHGA